MEITFIFVKFEGCILSGIGTRLIPVSRQAGRQAGRLAGRQAGWLAGRQADETLIVFDNFKIL